MVKNGKKQNTVTVKNEQSILKPEQKKYDRYRIGHVSVARIHKEYWSDIADQTGLDENQILRFGLAAAAEKIEREGLKAILHTPFLK